MSLTGSPSAERFANEGDVEGLTASLQHDRRDVRVSAVEVTWNIDIQDARLLEPFIAALQSESLIAVRSAAEVLGDLGDVRAVEPLIAALRDEDRDVQRAIVGALSKLGDVRAVEPLIAALTYSRPCMIDVVAKALEAITGQGFGQNAAAWRRWWKEQQ
jgi:HEAT repeat protein